MGRRLLTLAALIVCMRSDLSHGDEGPRLRLLAACQPSALTPYSVTGPRWIEDVRLFPGDELVCEVSIERGDDGAAPPASVVDGGLRAYLVPAQRITQSLTHRGQTRASWCSAVGPGSYQPSLTIVEVAPQHEGADTYSVRSADASAAPPGVHELVFFLDPAVMVAPPSSLLLTRGLDHGGTRVRTGPEAGEEDLLLRLVRRVDHAKATSDQGAIEQASREMIAVRPDSAFAHLLLARALEVQGRVPEALAAARHGLALIETGEERDPDVFTRTRWANDFRALIDELSARISAPP